MDTRQERLQAMSLGKAVKASLLRAVLDDAPRLAFADYGRHVETMERLRFVQRGLVAGMPGYALTAQGLHLARTLQDFRGALHHGMAWSEHIPTDAPNGTAAEQKDTWGDKAFQGLTPYGQPAFSNGHIALLMPRERKLLPTAHNDRRTFSTIDMTGIWTKSLEGLEPIEPVAVSGILDDSRSRTLVDDRQVWFSDGSTLRGAYMDAILRQYPDAQFHSDPRKARAGMLTITHEGDVVGVAMPTQRGRVLHMPLGVADAMAAHWEARGQDPVHKSLERGMASSLAELRAGVQRGIFSPVASKHLVLHGHWKGMAGQTHAYPDLHWSIVDNLGLHAMEGQDLLMRVSQADMQGLQTATRLHPQALAARWAQEACMAKAAHDGEPHVLALDAYGVDSRLTSSAQVERYRVEHGLPATFAEDAMAQLQARSRGVWPLQATFAETPATHHHQSVRQELQHYGMTRIPDDAAVQARLDMERRIGVHPSVSAAVLAQSATPGLGPSGMQAVAGEPTVGTHPTPQRPTNSHTLGYLPS